MDPFMEMWLFESWLQDLQDKNEFAKSYAILSGSFANPEMARNMIQKENPTYMSSDEDFEESTRWVLEDREKQKNYRRRVID